MQSDMVIAIDGPAGAGKSTIAKIVAQRLGFLYIDTGAMFRAIAWKLIQNNISPDDEKKVAEVLNNTEIVFNQEKEGIRVVCDNIDITEAIRSVTVSQKVSAIATMAVVRSYLLKEQRSMACNNNVVMDGRDIGTVVFPDAKLKVFLEASCEVRAKRRALELRSKGCEADEAEIKAQIEARDKMDREREIAPLKKADDAIEIDTSNLTIDEVVCKILALYHERCL